jgi:hypothetical protein
VQRATISKELNDQEQLFMSLADGVSHTMLQLALLSEQAAQSPRGQRQHWGTVHDLTQASLQLLESYTLTMRMQGSTSAPELEPVAITTVLQETAHLLEPFAKQLSVHLELDMPQRLTPIMTDRAVLQSALLSLGQVFIAAQSETGERGAIRLGAHKSRYGVVAGWYGKQLGLSASALTKARRLHGWARQPLPELASGASTGVFIADSLLRSVSSQLHVARYHNATGLAATLQACQQLRLV